MRDTERTTDRGRSFAFAFQIERIAGRVSVWMCEQSTFTKTIDAKVIVKCSYKFHDISKWVARWLNSSAVLRFYYSASRCQWRNVAIQGKIVRETVNLLGATWDSDTMKSISAVAIRSHVLIFAYLGYHSPAAFDWTQCSLADSHFLFSRGCWAIAMGNSFADKQLTNRFQRF